jgi:hypothetical protein
MSGQIRTFYLISQVNQDIQDIFYTLSHIENVLKCPDLLELYQYIFVVKKFNKNTKCSIHISDKTFNTNKLIQLFNNEFRIQIISHVKKYLDFFEMIYLTKF